jgi:hypothetical protein
MKNVETPFCVDFGYWEMEHQNISSQGMSKCEKNLLVLVSDTGSWSVETLCNRNVEMMKHRNAFFNKAMVTVSGHIIEEL